MTAIGRPRLFTWPFHYVPHPLCVEATRQVQRYVASQTDWAAELRQGKMLGVLVVEDNRNELGFLAAFSGNLAGTNRHDYFVPPIYDLLDPQGEFKRGEREITAINHRIAQLEQAPELIALKRERDDCATRQLQEQEQFKQQMEQARQRRHALRDSSTLTDREQQSLVRESQFMKAELKRLRHRQAGELSALDALLAAMTEEITGLREQRKQMSERLQQRLFDLYVVLNGHGERQTLTQVFADFARSEGKSRYAVPPGGAGECCAPKLLQYAYSHALHPVCMAEFWWGDSPVGEVRHHGHYYPACRSKCLPILTFMLQGLKVEPNPLAERASIDIKEIYDDQWLTVVEKPAGMLSEPGKLLSDSALHRFKARHPEASGPILVHRLDQETSGLLVFAKDKTTHKELQRQFAEREVRKQYVALLDGVVKTDGGNIDLPLLPNVDDRPRQVVDFELGKKAFTMYSVMERTADGKTWVIFTPLTGRTHQLRVHASHPLGLGCPIVGDMLYGTAAQRLMLHAASLSFVHPVSGQRLHFRSEPQW
ncbi:MAG: RNA pseudouridine synthase [Muribaculaceae bacterium]|nr:RNA pseudouridine synthase [Muribaculaceae bacterium]